MPELKLSPAGRRYGYVKDTPDHRDFGVGRFPFLGAVEPQATNGPLLGPVLNQGQQGSCTAHADAANREFLHWKEYANQGKPYAPGADGLYSPAFLYFLERQVDAGWTGGPFLPDPGDVGSMGRTCCIVANKYGACLRTEMPYNDADFSTPPTDQQLADALTWKAGSYHRLLTVDDMKSCIASGYCFMVGFTVYESFENIGSNGIWTPNKATEQVLGGHEVLAFAYDDSVNGGSFGIRNSWGADWGASGNFWMRYTDAADPDVLQDAWIQHLGHW